MASIEEVERRLRSKLRDRGLDLAIRLIRSSPTKVREIIEEEVKELEA